MPGMLQVAARAGQFASTLLDDVGQVEKRVGFLPPETEGSQCFLELLKRRPCHDLPRWIPCDETGESTRNAGRCRALEQYLSYGKLTG